MWSMIRNAVARPFGWNDEVIHRDDSERVVPGEYEPTIKDVLVVKAMLKKGLGLPLEIIDSLIDHAEYWPHTTSFVRYDPNLRVSARAYEGHEHSEEEFLIRSPPLGFPGWPAHLETPEGAPTSVPGTVPDGPVIDDIPPHISRRAAAPRAPRKTLPPDAFVPSIGAIDSLLAHPCRKIVFTIRSRDQGWGGDYDDHGTYNKSWTWFEAGLERWCQPESEGSSAGKDDQQPQRKPPSRFEDIQVVHPSTKQGRDNKHSFYHPLYPIETLKIQCNELASRQVKEHRVVWKHTDNVDPKDKEAVERLASCGRGRGTGDGKFVTEMQLGDMVTVWAKARFPGWWNEIESVKVDVFWMV